MTLCCDLINGFLNSSNVLITTLYIFLYFFKELITVVNEDLV